jgi:cytochrome c556
MLPINGAVEMKRVLLFCGLVLFGLGQITGEVSAHKGAKGVVKQRMDLMTGIKKNMKTITDMARGKAPFKTSVIVDAATDIGKRAVHAPSLFPAGSHHKPSEARAEIWREWP